MRAVLSRMAESLYWIGRYVERAEQTARLTEATFRHTVVMGSTTEAEARRQRHWAALLDIVGEHSAFPPEGPEGDEETVPAHLIFSSENGNSIVECIARARDNAHTMRHQLATEMWEALNRFHLDVQRPGRRRQAASGAESTTRFCRAIVDFSQLLQGVTDSTMPREEGWYFLQAGKFLERAEWTARTIDVNYRLLVGANLGSGDRHALAAAAEDPQPWGTLLRSLSSYESYHRIQSRGIRPTAVIELLILSAVLLLLFAVVLAGSMIMQRHSNDKVAAIIEFQLPLAAAISNLDVGTSDYELHLERMLRRNDDSPAAAEEEIVGDATWCVQAQGKGEGCAGWAAKQRPRNCPAAGL